MTSAEKDTYDQWREWADNAIIQRASRRFSRRQTLSSVPERPFESGQVLPQRQSAKRALPVAVA